MSKQKKGVVKSIFKYFFLFIILISLLGGIVLMAGYLAIANSFPDVKTQNIDSLLQETSFIYDDEGNISEKIQSNVYRTIVPIEDIPMQLQRAFISIEDERFYEHFGIDVKRLFGALWHDIKVGALAQGGSTITMQLSKNLLTTSDPNFTRKLTDIVYAMEMEKRLSKTQILYAYLNTVFLGSNVHGVQAAAKSYFNKNVSELNLAESAMIAGITQYPTKYIPYKLKEITYGEDVLNMQLKLYPPNNSYIPTENDLQVYSVLRNTGKIDQYEYMLLKNGSLVVTKAELNPDSVNRQKVVLKKMLELGAINNEQYQEALNTPIIISFPPRNNSGISSYFNDRVKSEAVKILIELGNSEEKANNLLKFGGLKIYSTLNTKIQRILENEFADSSNFPNSFVDDNGVIQPQGAMVVIDQKTGYVKALIGGRGQAGNYIYDRTDSPRQPGSAIKPLAVYLLALKDGMRPTTIIDDSPRKDDSMPGGYWPNNIYNVYYGNATMKKLLEVSSNVAAVKTLETLGSTRIKAINRSLDYLEQMGFAHLVRSSQNTVSNDENLSLALGGITNGVTPLEMASAYSGIANLGKQIKPSFITKIVDANDKLIYEFRPNIFEMIDEENAYRMTDMLQGVVINGSGKSAILDNMPSAGKTGTTDSRKDVYFVGYTPYYTASVWIGADTPAPLDYSSGVPATIWKKVMNGIDRELNLQNVSFQTPSTMNVEKEKEEEQKVIDMRRTDPGQEQLLDGLLFNENGENSVQNNSQKNQNVDNTQNSNENTTQQTRQPVQQQPVQQQPAQQNTTQQQDTAPPPEVPYEDTNNNNNAVSDDSSSIF
ncbi:transglycosylase domain-containing protein [Peptoanaerobacter stomatis]|uniref:transglycosylase domain-containing protein n=1 Tax=Peptoanaerobacter stomatis TaxID=796937 RepID=UPI003FA1634D